MTYELAFLPAALTEWKKLDASVREIFKKKLAQRLERPHVPSARLHGPKDRYKVKLRDAGCRLVYDVQDHIVTVLVVAVGRRRAAAGGATDRPAQALSTPRAGLRPARPPRKFKVAGEAGPPRKLVRADRSSVDLAPVQPALHGQEQGVGIGGFGEEVVHAGCQAARPVLDEGIRRQRHDRQVPAAGQAADAPRRVEKL